MKKSNEEIQLIENWISHARENLLFAKSGIKADYSPYHTICFLCQGSAEKYLKAFLLWNGWRLRKIHDLRELLIFCMDFESEFEVLKGKCGLLNEYITEGRYPGDLPFESITSEDAKEAIEAAEEIEHFVLKHINLVNPSSTSGDRPVL